MNRSDAHSRHLQLVEAIQRYDHAYYVLAGPLVSDFEYDRLFQELVSIERVFPELVSPTSPTQRVSGHASVGFQRVKHLVPMLSLDKIEALDTPSADQQPDRLVRVQEQDVITLSQLSLFDQALRNLLSTNTLDYFMEPKVDGVSISVHYRRGKLVLAATRGDGQAGDDVTANIRTIRGIPLELNLKTPPELIEVRGEVYMSVSDFDALNARLAASGEKTFPNARNATAGALKQLDPRLTALRPLRAVFYAVGAVDGIRFETQEELIKSLKEMGLPTQPIWWKCDSMADLLSVYRDEVVCGYDETKDLRKMLPYEIDGIVIKVNNLAYWARIPGRSRAPGYAIVHKPIPWITPAETTLRAITVQVGRTGVLTPVAELEPVFVQGSTVSRATLHNEDEIRRKDIRIGDTVVIRKAGMVIPEVVEVLTTKRPRDSKPFNLVEHIGGKCPACGGPISREKVSSGESEEVAWRCQNIAGCPAQLTRRVEHFAQRKALDIEALGGIVAEKLVERGLVREPLDLFDLKLEPLAKLNLGTDDEPRTFGEKNATKVLEALERAKTAPLHRWIHALAIPNIGEQTAYELSAFFPDLFAIVRSSLIRDTAELGEWSRLFRANKIGEREEETISQEERDQRKANQTRAKSFGNPIGRRLIEAGFATPAVKKDRKTPPPDWEANPLIGPISAQSINDWTQSELGQRILNRLAQLGINPKGVSTPANNTISHSVSVLSGKTFVLTGTLPTLSRDQASELIRKVGGSISGSVSKNTDFVLAGESAGSKFEKAQSLGIRILDEATFLSLIEKETPNQESQSSLEP